MQAIFKNKNKERCSKRTDLVNIVLCVRRISEYLEKEYIEKLEIRKFRV